MQVDDVRRLALALPESSEQPHHAMTSFRVGGKIFATVPPEQDRVHVMLDEAPARAYAAQEPGVEELWWGRSLSGVRVPLGGADQELVAELLELAWSRRAPTRLVSARNDEPGPDATRCGDRNDSVGNDQEDSEGNDQKGSGSHDGSDR